MNGRTLDTLTSRTEDFGFDFENMESKEYFLRVAAADIGARIEATSGTSPAFPRSEEQKEKLLELIGSMNGLD